MGIVLARHMSACACSTAPPRWMKCSSEAHATALEEKVTSERDEETARRHSRPLWMRTRRDIAMADELLTLLSTADQALVARVSCC